MPTADYRMQMQFVVTADPGQVFTLTEQDVTITTKQVHVDLSIMGPRRKKTPHIEVTFYGFSEDKHEAEVFIPGRKVAGSGFRLLPNEVVQALREIAPDAVRDALAERPAKAR